MARFIYTRTRLCTRKMASYSYHLKKLHVKLGDRATLNWKEISSSESLCTQPPHLVRTLVSHLKTRDLDHGHSANYCWVMPVKVLAL